MENNIRDSLFNTINKYFNGDPNFAVADLIEKILTHFNVTEKKPREFWIIRYEDDIRVEFNKVISVEDSFGEKAEIIHVREVLESKE